MRHLAPVPWAQVEPGAVVLISGVARRIMHILPVDHGQVHVFAEGLGPFHAFGGHHARTVTLDETDAMVNLFAAGLTPAPIGES